MTEQQQEGALSPYRVLDLAQGGCTLAGKILADLGADVIKVEPPGGDPMRRLGPFYEDIPHPQGSLFWMATNTNKRSITLDIRKVDGQDLLQRLVKTADFLIESFDPGYLEGLGLGYGHLRSLNPGLIMLSITPFGQDGPYSHYKGPDMVPWAMSGYMGMCGDPDRAPVRPSQRPQAYFHAAAMGAAAALMALYQRHQTGEGQHIDQAAQQLGAWLLAHTYQFYEYEGVILRREGAWRQFGPTRTRTVFPCKDGHIVFMLAGGLIGTRGNRELVEWIAEGGMAPSWLREMDWDNFDARLVDQGTIYQMMEVFTAFFRTKTKAELLEEAVRRSLLVAPVNTVADVWKNPQLRARDFWVEAEHPELGATLTYPGAPFRMSETPMQGWRRAPLIGEHNLEVYRDELGLSAGELKLLMGSGVI